MLSKDVFIKRRSASLRVLDAEIARLTEYAERATSDIAAEYQQAIWSLEATRDKATMSLQKLDTVDEDGWDQQDATKQLETDWTELRNAILVAISATYSERVES